MENLPAVVRPAGGNAVHISPESKAEILSLLSQTSILKRLESDYSKIGSDISKKIDRLNHKMSLIFMGSPFPNPERIPEVEPQIGLNVCDPALPHDHVLTIGDDKFYIQKSVLSSCSSYFESMFNGNFKEARMNQTELEDVDPQEFRILLQMTMYPGAQHVNDDNVVLLWTLAERFAIPSAIETCEQYLCNTDDFYKSNIKLTERLDIADWFNSAKLKAAVFDKMTQMGM